MNHAISSFDVMRAQLPNEYFTKFQYYDAE